jgi:hypothetical protein
LAPFARCVVDLRGAGAVKVWALVEVPSGNANVTYTVSLSSGIPVINIQVPQGPVAQQLHVVGPGHVPAETNFPLRLFWGQSSATEPSYPLETGTYYGAVMIDAVPGVAPNVTGSAGIVPLSITRNPGGDDVADVVFPGLTRNVSVWGPQTLQHTFIDVPQGVTDARGRHRSGVLAHSVVLRADPNRFPAQLGFFAGCRGARGSAGRWLVARQYQPQSPDLDPASPGAGT